MATRRDRSLKIEKREKKRKKKDERERNWKRRVQWQRDFPAVEIYSQDSSSDSLTTEVKRIFRELPADPSLPHDLRHDLRRLKHGKYRFPKSLHDRLSIRLGREVYRRLSQFFQTSFRIASDIEIVVDESLNEKVEVNVRSLIKLSSTVFASPRRSKIKVGDKELLVAFGNHALQRIGDRTVMDPDAYECRGQVFAIPYWCQYFESFQNRDGQDLELVRPLHVSWAVAC